MSFHKSLNALEFAKKSALELAPLLLGYELGTQDSRGRESAGIIVETEAYMGPNDPASHAHRGPTPRSKVMFEAGGIAYVYFTYGSHHCVNIVTGPAGEASAVLIRALEPTRGLELMKERRNKIQPRELCSGPGKLTQALGINLSHNELSFDSKKLWIRKGPEEFLKGKQIKCGPRIGIKKAIDFPWRFWIEGNENVSKR